jgi:hypothetical protein
LHQVTWYLSTQKSFLFSARRFRVPRSLRTSYQQKSSKLSTRTPLKGPNPGDLLKLTRARSAMTVLPHSIFPITHLRSSLSLLILRSPSRRALWFTCDIPQRVLVTQKSLHHTMLMGRLCDSLGNGTPKCDPGTEANASWHANRRTDNNYSC